ncbi:hypothetical protein SLS62_011439, partial [Diatrype stigma]
GACQPCARNWGAARRGAQATLAERLRTSSREGRRSRARARMRRVPRSQAQTGGSSARTSVGEGAGLERGEAGWTGAPGSGGRGDGSRGGEDGDGAREAGAGMINRRRCAARAALDCLGVGG